METYHKCIVMITGLNVKCLFILITQSRDQSCLVKPSTLSYIPNL